MFCTIAACALKFSLSTENTSVPDPDPDPPDPRVFGPPGSGSGSISQRYLKSNIQANFFKKISFLFHLKGQ